MLKPNMQQLMLAASLTFPALSHAENLELQTAPVEISSSSANDSQDNALVDWYLKTYFSVSFGFEKLLDWYYERDWISLIKEDEKGGKLYLSSLPIAAKAPASIPDELRALNLSAVLSAVLPFETQQEVFGMLPISDAQWEEAGVDQKYLPLADRGGYTPPEINEGIAFIEKHIAHGHNVLVHCKAGKGRSATIVLAYLVRHYDLHLRDALNYLMGKRDQVHLNRDQIKAVITWYRMEKVKKELKQQVPLVSGTATANAGI